MDHDSDILAYLEQLNKCMDEQKRIQLEQYIMAQHDNFSDDITLIEQLYLSPHIKKDYALKSSKKNKKKRSKKSIKKKKDNDNCVIS